MYELVKKKNTGRKILYWVLGLFLAGTILKEFSLFMRGSMDEQLVRTANEINSHAPIIVDSTTRLDNVTALPGKIFQYNYTITKMDRSTIDTAELARSGKEYLIEKLKSDPKAVYFKDNDVELRARYVDESGKYLADFSVSPVEYK